MLFAFLNVMFVGLVSMIAQAMQFSDSLSLYAIGQILVGQELPEESAVSAPEQVFAFAVGILGLSSFAIVLALVEQAVLEVLEANVRQGSNVIEEAHVVLLSWGTSTRDLAQTVRIVKEICASQQYSWIKDGQLSIVVLSQGREKLEMESLFDGALPEQQRAGCRLVFRQVGINSTDRRALARPTLTLTRATRFSRSSGLAARPEGPRDGVRGDLADGHHQRRLLGEMSRQVGVNSVRHALARPDSLTCATRFARSPIATPRCFGARYWSMVSI